MASGSESHRGIRNPTGVAPKSLRNIGDFPYGGFTPPPPLPPHVPGSEQFALILQLME
jgi:hypothetical protein